MARMEKRHSIRSSPSAVQDHDGQKRAAMSQRCVGYSATKATHAKKFADGRTLSDGTSARYVSNPSQVDETH